MEALSTLYFWCTILFTEGLNLSVFEQEEEGGAMEKKYKSHKIQTSEIKINGLAENCFKQRCE